MRLEGLSLRAALREAMARYEAAGLASGNADARFLVLGVLGLEARDLALDGERRLDAGEGRRLDAALARRLAGEPVARILETWEFWGLSFRLAPEALVPRPDTETLVEAALAAIPDRGAPLRILDLGTGSGCILVALLRELPHARGLGLDRSREALHTARGNADANGVGSRAGFVAGDWCDALRGPFDLVVSNPPYIARGVIASLDPAVRIHDPIAALDGGEDGLDAYRRIFEGMSRGSILAPGGTLVVEIGFDQARAVRLLARSTGLGGRGVVRDLAGHDRVLVLRRSCSAHIAETGLDDAVVQKTLVA